MGLYPLLSVNKRFILQRKHLARPIGQLSIRSSGQYWTVPPGGSLIHNLFFPLAGFGRFWEIVQMERVCPWYASERCFLSFSYSKTRKLKSEESFTSEV